MVSCDGIVVFVNYEKPEFVGWYTTCKSKLYIRY